jgi:hypothetical protein
MLSAMQCARPVTDSVVPGAPFAERVPAVQVQHQAVLDFPTAKAFRSQSTVTGSEARLAHNPVD